MNTPERWLPVKGYEGLYEVSDQGRVRSLDRLSRGRNGALRRVQGRVLVPQRVGSQKQYFAVALYGKDGKGKQRKVAHLVAAAFIGPRPEDAVVAHGPAGSLDNSIQNVSYKTRAENQGPDRLRDGTDCRGEKSPTSRLNRHQVRLARRLYESKCVSMSFLASLWSVAPATVRLAARGENWGWL